MTQGIVNGIVMTEDGKPLYGVAITTTRTDNTSYKLWIGFDGRFTINDLQAGSSLLIECRGFKGQTLKADFASEMVVKLVRDPDYKGKIIIPVIQNVNFRNSDFTPAKALVVIDGVITDYEANLKVNPGEIKSFKVLADKEATRKYGDKGKDGVIEIILFGNKSGLVDKKLYNSTVADTSIYITQLDINHIENKGEFIDIPVSGLKDVSVWTYHDINNSGEKELRFINIMTRDYYKVIGKVIGENGNPLAAVKISISEDPIKATSDKDGRFLIEDVRENALLEFSLPGFKPYYINTSFVPFNMDLTIELKKD